MLPSAMSGGGGGGMEREGGRVNKMNVISVVTLP